MQPQEIAPTLLTRIPLCLLIGLTLWLACGLGILAAQTREETIRRANDRLIPQAESGNLFAIGQLARNYSYLDNFEEAARWYRRGAELGVPDMQISYAHLLVEGKGVARNEKEALALYESAASKNFSSALLPLARLYAQGAGGAVPMVVGIW